MAPLPPSALRPPAAAHTRAHTEPRLHPAPPGPASHHPRRGSPRRCRHWVCATRCPPWRCTWVRAALPGHEVRSPRESLVRHGTRWDDATHGLAQRPKAVRGHHAQPRINLSIYRLIRESPSLHVVLSASVLRHRATRPLVTTSCPHGGTTVPTACRALGAFGAPESRDDPESEHQDAEKPATGSLSDFWQSDAPLCRRMSERRSGAR